MKLGLNRSCFYFQVQSKEEENRALQEEMADARRKHEVGIFNLLQILIPILLRKVLSNGTI